MFAFLAVEVYEPLDKLLFPSLPLDWSVGLWLARGPWG